MFPTPNGKARFVNTVYQPVAEPRESRFPFSLNTGRLRDHWHGMSRTSTLARLFGHGAEPSVQLHAQDMARPTAANPAADRVVIPIHQVACRQQPPPARPWLCSRPHAAWGSAPSPTMWA